MRIKYTASLRRKMITTVSASIMAALTSTAIAQEAEEATDEVVVTGIRQALESSLDIKRNAKGVVDSISAEDMGKFPDSNLAEALQRITGVSIDRDQTSGEGKTVTVRGFGADYNMVTMNGRTMPTSTLGNFASAPSTRSFDFGNLAPEAVSRVDIYKTAKSTTPSGGVGSTIDIRTTRPLDAPGFNASFGIKNIDDKSVDVGDDPSGANTEVSAIIYNTFLDDRVGVSMTAIRSNMSHAVGSFRHQWSGFEAYGDAVNPTPGNDELGVNDAAHFAPGGAGTKWDGYPIGYYGDVVNDGQGLAADTLMSVLNGNTGYYLDELEQERDNFQLTFQARPVDSVTLTADWTLSSLEHEVHSTQIGVHNMDNPDGRFGVTSNFGAGNPATPTSTIFSKSQSNQDCDWNAAEFWCRPGIDGVFNTIGYQNNVTEVESLGLNVEWDVDEALSLAFDYHNSISESLPKSPFGSNAYIGSDALNHRTTSIDYTKEIPVISIYEHHPDLSAVFGTDPINAGTRFLTGAGNVRSIMINKIEQGRVDGTYDMSATSFADYVDEIAFGGSFTENKVESGFGEIQAGNWDGVLVPNWGGWPYFAGDVSDDLFSDTIDLRPYFSGLTGGDEIFAQAVKVPYERWFGAYQQFYTMQLNKHYADNNNYKPAAICGTNTVEGCKNLAFTTHRQLAEDVTAFYVQGSKDFVIEDMPASLVVGLRFETTDVNSLNLVPEYANPMTVNADKVNATPTGNSLRLETEGSYENLLPSVDFDIDVMEDVKVRASYSQTITRQTYDQLAGGVVINPLGSTTKQNPGGFTFGGNEGNPNLEPFETDNFDLAAEWYYGDVSYLSVGYFNKKATNYVGTANKYIPQQGLVHPTFNEPAIFNISYPNPSNREETIDGIEIAVQHDFGDYSIPGVDLTGFGVILNATVVDTDADYNNTTANSAHAGEFALVGISDSYNAVAYYDRYGLSARIAYSWRDKFLNYSGLSSGYTQEYDQVDANISYAVPGTGVTITYDGINLNEEGRHTFERDNPAYTTWRSAGHAKHYVGLRWNY